jgi:hypothetical protein
VLSPAATPTAEAQALTTIRFPCTVNNVSGTCVVQGTFQVVNGALTFVGNIISGPGITTPIPVTIPVDLRFPGSRCTLLLLTLGPLHLEVLGLVIDLNRVVLTIRGEGGLGSLLCDILGALGSGNLGRVADLLNQLLGGRTLP